MTLEQKILLFLLDDKLSEYRDLLDYENKDQQSILDKLKIGEAFLEELRSKT